MSASIRVTEDKARSTIINYIINCSSKEELSEFLDICLKDRLYNTTIVPTNCSNNDNNLV